MSTTIDERVVEMRFDNQHFEKNVKHSLGTINKLKSGLNFNESAKSLNSLNKATKSFSMNGIASGVEAVKVKFSALEVMAVTALANITNSAVNAGKRIVSALTIDPVKTGFQEYETQINAVQTILANTQSKGKTLQDVNAALDELNTYADKTIYNFTEMTRNIGTFTAAGVDLDTSVQAIKGIANLAAVSGSTSQQASTAMYQLSQALASGTVKLMDWNSVVNAGMGGQVFQDSLKETARVHGIAIDDMIKSEGSFRETLKDGWLTSDILTETLAKFTGDLNESQLRTMGYTEEQIAEIIKLGKTANDAATKVKTFTQLFDTLKEAVQSGWTQTWETIVGDFEEAKSFLTELSNIFGYLIGKSAESRNSVLEGWADLGGRTKLLEVVKNTFNAIASVVVPIKEAFDEIFPAPTAERLMNLTDGLANFTKKLQLTRKQSENLKKTFKGLFAIVDIVADVFGGFVKGTLKLAGKLFGEVDTDVLSLSGSFGDMLVKLRDWMKTSDVVGKTMDKVTDTIRDGVVIFKNWIKAFSEIPQVQGVMTKLEGFFVSVRDKLNDLPIVFEEFKASVSVSLNKVGDKFDEIREKISNFFSGIQNGFRNIGLGEVLTVGLGASLIAFIVSLKKAIDTIKKPFDSFSSGLKGVNAVLKAYATDIKAKALIKIAGAIAIFAGTLALLTFVDQSKLRSAAITLGVFATAMIGVVTILSILSSKMSKMDFAVDNFTKMGVAILAMAGGIYILTQAISTLESIHTDGILDSIGIIGTLAVGLSVVAKALSKSTPQLTKGSVFMISFALSLKLLVEVMEDILLLDVNGMRGSLDILLWAMAGLSLLAVSAGKIRFGTGVGIMGIVLALKVLVSSLDDIADIDFSKIKSSMVMLVTIFGMFSALMIASRFAGKNAGKAGVGIMAMSTSLLIIMKAFKEIAAFDSSTLDSATKTIATILGTFALLTLSTALAGKNAVKAGIGILAMSTAMLMLSGVITIISKIDPDGIKNAVGAVVALELCFGALIAVTKLAQGCTMTLLTLAGVVIALTTMMGVLSMIDPNKLTGATIAISAVMGMFALLVASTAVVGKAMGAAFIIATTIGSLSVALYLLSSLPIESTLGAALSLSTLMLALSASMVIISLVPIQGALYGIAGLAVVIAGMTAILAALGGLSKIEGFNTLMGDGANILGVIGTAIGNFIGGIIGGIAAGATSTLPQIADNLSQFATNLVPFCEQVNNIDSGVLEGVKNIVSTILLLTAANVLDSMTSWMTGGSSLVSFGDDLISFGEAFVKYYDVIKHVKSDVVESSANAAKALAEFAATVPNMGGVAAFFAGENSLIDFAEGLVPFGKKMVKYGEAVANLNTEAVTKSATAGQALSELANTLPNSGGLLGEFLGENGFDEFSDGLVSFGEKMVEYGNVVSNLNTDSVTNSTTAGMALSELANSLPNSGGILGDFLGENGFNSFSTGLVTFGERMVEYADVVAGLDANAVTNSTAAGKALSELAHNLPNSGGLAGWFAGENDMGAFGQQLVTFGRALYDYSSYVKDIDTGIVSSTINAAQSIVELQKSVPETGAFSSGTLLSEFGNELVKFGKSFNEYYSYISAVGTEQLSAVIIQCEKLAALAGLLQGTDSNALTQFGDGLSYLFLGLSDGTEASISHITANITSLVDGILSIINSKMALFVESGQNLMISFDTGLKYKKSELYATAKSISDNLITVLESQQANFIATGEFYMEGLVLGLQNGIGNVKKAALEVASALSDTTNRELDIHSPSGVGEESGKWYDEGVAKGVKDGVGKVVDAGEKLVGGLGDTVSDGLTEILDEQTALSGSMLDEYEDYYAKWAGIVEDGTSEVTEIQEESVATTEKVKKKTAEGNKKTIEETESYWAKLLEIHKNGADAKKYKDMKLVDFEKEILDQTVDIWGEYTNALASKNDSIVNQIGLFEEVTHPKAEDMPTADKLKKNLNDQIKEYESFAHIIASLNNKISDGNFKDAINDMSISSINELRVLNNMTDAELTHYAELYEYKYALARQAATTQLDSLATETEQKLSNLYGGVDVNLTDFASTFDGGMESISKYVQLSMDQAALAKESGSQIVDGYAEGITQNQAGNEAAVAMIDNAEMAAREAAEIHSPSELFRREVGSYLTEGVAVGMTDKEFMVRNSATQLIVGALTVLRNARGSFVIVGQNASMGFKEGILSKASEIAAAAAQVASDALAAAQAAIDSHSPSRKFMELGQFADEGFAIGLRNYSKMVSDESYNVGSSAVNSISSAIANVSSLIENGIDSEPTIRPVLDLSNVSAGTHKLSSMLSRNSAMSISTGMKRNNSSTDTSTSSVPVAGGNTYNMIQNNYSPKSLSRIDIYRQTKNLFGTMKGTVSGT